MTPGTKIGDFEILSRLGEGGMGEVYRARDTRLRRDVAVKILPAALAADADRLERLSREARMLASLNHPNIAAIYSVETAGPVHALVLELVEGETLGARIRRGPLTVSEARSVGRQMAAALDAAHECGIVHRDLKPENVMLGPRGLVKVLDFGLAKTAATAAALDAATVSVGPTADGAIVGTVAYMSPEQARGLRVDRRADIWAFGCVLYEMLTGRRAFGGATLSDTIVSTLEKDPDWSALPPETPPGIRRLLVRTLQKDPHDRLRDIADGIPDLEEISAVPAAPAKAPANWIPWALAAIAVAASGWLIIKDAPPPPADPILGSEVTPITRDAGISTSPALSRDGRLLAYASDRAGGGTLDIWVQQVTGGGAIRLTDDEADDTAPDFSPDGREIVFQSDRGGGGAYIVSALVSATPRLVARGGREPRYSPDGKRIAYWSGAWRGGPVNTMSGLYVMSLAGGEPQPVAATLRSARAPVWAPDGRSLLFLGRTDNRTPVADSFDWYWVKLDGSAPVKVGLLEDAALRAGESQPAAWTDDNEVLFSDSTDLWSVSISPTDGRMQGAPRRLTVSAGSYRTPAIGADGRIIFASTQDIRVIERAPLGSLDQPRAAAELYADFSTDTGRPSETRDGSIIAFERETAAGKEIWTRNVRSGAEQLITRVDTRWALSATISPGGARISYTLGEGYGAIGRGFVVETARGVPSQVCERCVVTGFLSDERHLLLYSGGTIKVIDVISGTSRDAVTTAEGELNRPHVSPDERWIAFRHDGKSFVTPFTPGRPPDRSAWMEIEDPTGAGRPAGWALDSRTVYLLLDTDGFRCLWGQGLDAAGRLDGTPAPVRHFHGADWAALSTSFGNTITPEGFLYATMRRRGNIWSLVRPPGASSQELKR
jgi:serine/threonine protein kinase